MKLNREGVQLNAEERNKRNQNWTTLEDELSGIGDAIADGGDAKKLAENVQAQVNALVVQGDSSVEARQARVDAKGVEAATLKARLDAEQNAVTARLAETGERVDNIVATSGDGTIPTELVDMRVLNGKTYSTAGSALRSIAAGTGLADKSVSYLKQDFVKFSESENLFNGSYGDMWVRTDGTKSLYRQTGLSSAIVKITPNSVIDIKTVGEHNRFTLAFLNDPNATIAEDIFHVNSETTGNERFVVKNNDYQYVLIGVSNGGSLPQLIVKNLNTGMTFKQEAETESTLPDTLRYVNPTTLNWEALAIKTGVIRPIMKDSKVKIETVGTHNRFAVYVFDTYINTPSKPTRLFPSTVEQNSSGNVTYEFFNTTANYVYVYLTTSAEAAKPTVKITQSFNVPETLKSDTGTPVIATPTGAGIGKVKEVHPVMFGVKMSNERDKSRGYSETPRPVGWLYYHPETYKLLYANGEPENMEYLCDWKQSITWNGSSTPGNYRPFITRDGDIIFVWRGDMLGDTTGLANVRQNPIVYPAGDWNNPVVVDLGTGVKPTAWLQNCGADFMYNQNIFMFSEYTRPSHENTHVWRVTKPFTNPANWKIAKSFPLSGSNQTGMKHCHTINYDTFSGLIYLTTGDDDSAAKIFSSSDYGVTWDLVLEGQRKYARVLNFVFTKDKVYWANDDSLHGFYSVNRGVNGIPDFSNITQLYDLTGNPPTYVNCLIDNPNGILILDRYDGAVTTPLKVHFWHIPTATMHVIAEILPVGGTAKMFGFRVEAANFYQAKGSNKIVTGFATPQNDMAILGNTTYLLNKDRVNNVVLEVIPNGETFELKMSTITDRSL